MRISDWSSDVCSSDLTRLPALRVDDPSLQVHACHTRLRELQVLHDQLRALFEDPRFDPPLQPREVAVLAPDIDRSEEHTSELQSLMRISYAAFCLKKKKKSEHNKAKLA